MERREWIERFEQYQRRRSPGRRTAIDYVSDVQQFAAMCQKPWREVTMHDIDAFVDRQRQAGLSAATVKRRVAALKVFFDFLAEEEGDLSWPNPVRFKRHAGRQPHRLPRDLCDADLERLWAVVTSPRDQAWFVLMLRAGLRVGEAIDLQLADLLLSPVADQPARLRVMGKGRKERLVLLTADAYAVLAGWLQVRPASEQTFVFLNEHGQPLTASGIQWLLRRYGAQVGLTPTPHQLRHTFARQLTEAGMPVTSLGKLLGHVQVSTTQVYTAGADPQLAQAYQVAMSHVNQACSLVEASSAQPQMPPPPIKRAAPMVPPPTQPNWDAWAPNLPPALRQASLALTLRRLPNWKAQRQKLRARQALGELRRFWEWQLTCRPIYQPSELRLADLQAYQTAHRAQGHSPGTINLTLDYVVALLREQADQGQPVETSIFRLRRLPRGQSLPRHLREAESQQLEAYVRRRLDSIEPIIRLENACFLVLAHTGLRASECVDLQVQDLDLAAKRLTVRQGKDQRDRIVYLSDVACQALTFYLAAMPRPATSPLLTRPNGKPITYSWLYEHTLALGQAANVTALTPHRLRHTFATRLLNAGMDVTRIQKLLGHQHIGTTMIYARVHDTTVESDYRCAMNKIEHQQMPLSTTTLQIDHWPTHLAHSIKVQVPLDNSV